MECRAPSEFLSPQQASRIGRLAEAMIADRYLLHRGKSAFFPQGFEDFRDPDAGISNTNLYNAFLNFHNPWFEKLGGIERLLQLRKVRLVNVPDLATHSPALNQSLAARREFYEIKPNSQSGRSDGYTKLTALDQLHDVCDLKYQRGTVWSPDEHITISKFDGISPFLKISIHYKLLSPGLVVYEICVDDPLEEFSKELLRFLLMLVLAIILALIFKGGPIRGPGPVTAPAGA